MEPSSRKNRFRAHGWLGLGMILFVELSLAFCSKDNFTHVVRVWTTPICWWGYIFLTDALIYWIKGESLLCSRTREFVFCYVPFSIAFWLLFEVYNFHLANWRYEGLPKNVFVLVPGLALSFATIMPGMFQTAELFEALRVFDGYRIAKLRVTHAKVYGGVTFGLLFVIVPLLLPRHIAKYTFGFVWTGFVLLFDPIVYCSGGPSLLGDLEKGNLRRIMGLFAAGYVCGFLWEFWNYWAAAKWVYTAPFTQDVKVFEMPVAGFLGFGPFAWEYFCGYQFFRLLLRRPTREASPQGGSTP